MTYFESALYAAVSRDSVTIAMMYFTDKKAKIRRIKYIKQNVKEAYTALELLSCEFVCTCNSLRRRYIDQCFKNNPFKVRILNNTVYYINLFIIIIYLYNIIYMAGN